MELFPGYKIRDVNTNEILVFCYVDDEDDYVFRVGNDFIMVDADNLFDLLSDGTWELYKSPKDMLVERLKRDAIVMIPNKTVEILGFGKGNYVFYRYDFGHRS